MRIDVLTLFPDACRPFFAASILGRAQQSGLVTVHCHDIRDRTNDPHGKVDDRPFGGGPGMVMMCQPVFDAVEMVENEQEGEATRILLTPQGERLNQRMVEELAALPWLVMIAGHYEGFDERIRQGLSAREVSIGDYVLSGGESAAMVLVDAVVRLVPGVLGDPQSAKEESFSVAGGVSSDASGQDRTWDGVACLEYPQYTRPRAFRGMDVPEILLSGDHGRIAAWRAEQSRLRTEQRRPDLLSGIGPQEGGETPEK